jgi:hypothetical protein
VSWDVSRAWAEQIKGMTFCQGWKGEQGLLLCPCRIEAPGVWEVEGFECAYSVLLSCYLNGLGRHNVFSWAPIISFRTQTARPVRLLDALRSRCANEPGPCLCAIVPLSEDLAIEPLSHCAIERGPFHCAIVP